MKFYNREKETEALQNIEAKSASFAQMTVITGRRRIGKTALIRHSFRKIPFLYFFVARKSEALLCEELCDIIREGLNEDLGDFTSFARLFSAIMNISKRRNFTLVFDEFQNFKYANEAVFSDIQNLWDKMKESNTLCSEAIEITEYMSNEISRPVTQNSDYFIISNFVNFLLNVNQSTCSADEIIYPSVPAKGNGFNIAIKKESADKKIIFKHASLCFLIKNKMKSTYLLMNDSDSLCRDGNLKYIQRKTLLSDGDNIYNYNEINELFIN